MRLLTAVAVALLPAYAFRLLWLLVTDDTGRVVNGVLTFDGASWAVAIIGSLVGAAAVFLGVAVLDAGPQPLRRTLRALPAIAFLVGLLWVCLVLALLILDSAAPDPAPGAFFLIAVLGIATFGVVTPVALGVTGAVVQGVSKAVPVDLTGKRWRTGWLLALGCVAPVLLASVATNEQHPWNWAAGAAYAVFSALLLAGAAAVLSITLLGIYRQQVPGMAAAPRRRAARWMVAAGLAALFVPAALDAGAIAGAGLPSVTHTDEQIGHVMAIAWPAGRHPVLVTQQGILDCLDDTCNRYAVTELSIQVFDPNGNATILPDGTVYAFGQAEIEICDPQRHCEGGRQRGMIDQIGSPSAAHLVVGADGNPLIAAVAAADPGKTATVTLHRCRDRLCKTSDATELGTVPNEVRDSWDHRRVAVELGADGRVGVAVVVRDGVRFFGDGSPEQSARLDKAFRADALTEGPGGRLYSVITEHSGQPTLLPAGSPEGTLRAILQVCSDPSCDHVIRRVPIESEAPSTSMLPSSQPGEIWLMAVSPGGRVALVRPIMSDRVYTVTL